MTVTLENRRVELRAWRYTVKGVRGYEVPVYFLDADLPDNDPRDRELTGAFYGGDPYYRLSQEVLLGIGGVRMLRALGHTELMRYHMNEGHAALLTMELLEEEAKRAGRTADQGRRHRAGAQQVRLHHAYAGARRARQISRGVSLTRLFPDQVRFFDVKDASSVDLIKSILQAEQNLSGLAGSGAARRFGEHDVSGAEPEQLREWRGQAARRSFAEDVSERADRSDHEWRARGDVDFARFPRICSTGIFLPGARTITACAARWACRRKRFGRRICWPSTSLLEAVRKKTGTEAGSRGVYDRICAPRHRLQARGPDPERSGPFAANRQKCRRHSRSCYAGKAHPQRRRRKRDHQEDFQGQESAEEGGHHRFSGRLQHGSGREAYFRRRFVAEHAAISVGSFRHQRDESGVEWRAELEHSGWLVGGRAHRRRDRLVDRRTASRRSWAGNVRWTTRWMRRVCTRNWKA